MGEYISAEPCPECRGRTFARVDQGRLHGPTSSASLVRCINCKLVMDTRAMTDPTPTPAVGREEIARVIFENIKVNAERNAETGPINVTVDVEEATDAILTLLAPGETEATLRAEVERRFWRARALAAEAERDEAYAEGHREGYEEGQAEANGAAASTFLYVLKWLNNRGLLLPSDTLDGVSAQDIVDALGEHEHSILEDVKRARAERDRLSEEKRVLREALKQAAVRLEVTASIVTMTHKNSARLEMWASEASFALNQESPNGNP